MRPIFSCIKIVLAVLQVFAMSFGYTQSEPDKELLVDQDEPVVIRLNEYTGEIQWQRSFDLGLWTDIPGATEDTLLVLADQPSYYRALVTAGDCDPFYSHTIAVMIKAFTYNFYRPCPDVKTVADIDGNIYTTVLIGDQCWLAENLKVSRYSNGDQIPTHFSDTDWGQLSMGAYAVYPHTAIEGIDGDAEMISAYGKLYNWFAASDPRGVCPAGWHVPSNEDMVELRTAIGGNQMGRMLKSCLQVYSPFESRCDTDDHPRWNFSCSGHGTDDYGFSAYPGGVRWATWTFQRLGSFGHWWTYSTHPTNELTAAGMNLGTGVNLGSSFYDKRHGFSIRCLKD